MIVSHDCSVLTFRCISEHCSCFRFRSDAFRSAVHVSFRSDAFRSAVHVFVSVQTRFGALFVFHFVQTRFEALFILSFTFRRVSKRRSCFVFVQFVQVYIVQVCLSVVSI